MTILKACEPDEVSDMLEMHGPGCCLQDLSLVTAHHNTAKANLQTAQAQDKSIIGRLFDRDYMTDLC